MRGGTSFSGALREAEDGTTLIEVLLALMIMSTVVVGLLSAFMLVIQSAEIHRRQAIAETALRQYIEEVETASYTPCPLLPSAFAPKTYNYDVRVIAVDGWVKGTTPATFTAAACSGGETGAHRLTVEVTDPTGKATQRVNVVLRSSS